MSFIHSSLRILTFIWDTTVWGRQMLFISTKPSFVNYNWFWLVECGENEELDVKTSSSSFPWPTMTILCFLLAHSYFACVHTWTYNTNNFFFILCSNYIIKFRNFVHYWSWFSIYPRCYCSRFRLNAALSTMKTAIWILLFSPLRLFFWDIAK